MSLFILKPEKLSVLVEKTRLYHLVSVSAAGSYQSKNRIQWNCQITFQAAAAIPDKQAEENPSQARSEKTKNTMEKW